MSTYRCKMCGKFFLFYTPYFDHMARHRAEAPHAPH